MTTLEVDKIGSDAAEKTQDMEEAIPNNYHDDHISPPPENDITIGVAEDLTTQMAHYFVPHSDEEMANYTEPLSDIFLYNMSSYGYNMSEAEPYQRLEAEFGGWGEEDSYVVG